MRLARRVGELETKAAGGLVDARVDAVVAQEADDDVGVEVGILHHAGHVLVLFVRNVGHGGVELGGRRHHATARRRR